MSARLALLDSAVSPSEYIVWFLLAPAPVAVCLILLRNRSTALIAQVLYETEQAGAAGQDAPVAAIPIARDHVRIAHEDKGAKARETLADLYQLVETIARRGPQVERVSDAQISRDASDSALRP
jgi:hypothetical protein